MGYTFDGFHRTSWKWLGEGPGAVGVGCISAGKTFSLGSLFRSVMGKVPGSVSNKKTERGVGDRFFVIFLPSVVFMHPPRTT